jgi:hypothetical protein
MRTGGRPLAVISDQKAWNIGHATSGSLAPSSQRRAREMLDWTGIGRLCFCDSSMLFRIAAFALPIWPSQFAVYEG